MQDKKSEYLRIDEKENVIDSLNRALEFLREVEEDIYKWKWFIVTIHHVAYHFMLLALVNTDLSGIWQEPVIKRGDGLVDVFNSNNKLISFKKAFEYIQDTEKMSGYMNSRSFEALPCHVQSMKILNDELRNKFVHYRPLGWSIHNDYLIKVISPVLEIIEFLSSGIDRCCLEEDQINQIKFDIEEIRNILKKHKND